MASIETSRDTNPMSSELVATDGNTMPETGQDVLRDLRTNEVFVAIVGPAGAGVGTAAEILGNIFKSINFTPKIIKASALIRSIAESKGLEVPPIDERKTLENTQIMQDRGDDLRKGGPYGLPEDHSTVAKLALEEIAKCRAKMMDKSYSSGKEVMPDGESRAFIIDSLRHPAEVALLREVYKDAFALLGVVCDPKEREKRILANFYSPKKRATLDDKEQKQVEKFLNRDANAPEKYGQHVSDTFHKADFFVDNSLDSSGDPSGIGNSMHDQLQRFVNLISQNKEAIFRPTVSETAMYQAQSAQMRSACLSRQVGAALVDAQGNTVATGTNDVPKAGGGLYGENFSLEEESISLREKNDHRCAFRDSKFCSNTREQSKIIKELIEIFPELRTEEESLSKKIQDTRLGGLLEFSRAVHAEMDAILSASVSGISPQGCRLYVTTYPCHYCARHIVAAGIDEVQFIEPYPKSMATELHGDSITTKSDAQWESPSDGGSQVLFHPFVGVAPRLYRRVFLKDRSYKDDVSGAFSYSEPEWSRPTDMYKVAYPSLEVELTSGVDDVQ